MIIRQRDINNINIEKLQDTSRKGHLKGRREKEKKKSSPNILNNKLIENNTYFVKKKTTEGGSMIRKLTSDIK